MLLLFICVYCFFFQAEDGIRDFHVTGVQTCALPISNRPIVRIPHSQRPCLNSRKMDRYKNKYRIPSARAQWWDYGWNGAYFITICTQNRVHFFGEIKEGKMTLSRLGVIADMLWHEIPNHSKYAELGDFVVMPNHIHGILIL